MAEHLSYYAEPMKRAPGVLVSDYYSQPQDYKVNRPTGVPNWLLIYTVDGMGEFRAGERIHLCQAGDLMIIPPHTPQSYGTAEHHRWNFHWAHFIPQSELFVKVKLSDPIDGIYIGHIFQADLRERIIQAFYTLQRDFNGQSVYRQQLVLNALELIFILFADQASASRIDPRIEQIMHYLAGNFQSTIRVEELANLVSLSPSRLSHLFRDVVGDSIINVILKLRFRYAVNRLLFTTDPVGQIATDSGFSSLYYFSQKFHEYYGVSPSDYRKKNFGK